MDKEFIKLRQEIKEEIADDSGLLFEDFLCRKDGVPGKFTHVEAFGPERAAIKFAHDNGLLDGSVVHVRAHGRFLVKYGKTDNAHKQQMGKDGKMIPIIEVFK